MAPQKRSADAIHCTLKDVDMVLLDVEGTAAPTKFVTETLFPYVKDNVETYITKHFDEEECQSIVKALRTVCDEDKKNEVEGLVEIPVTDDKDELIKALINNVTWQMAQDRKTTALKQLQGHVLREAFKQGNIKAPMYEDVAPVLKKLCTSGKKVCVYSSGSVETQKLVFGHTESGDLQDHITEYYDTNVGAKKEAASYKKIAEECGVAPEKIIYLTDTPQEAAAASSAGMKVHILVRPDNVPLTDDDKKDFSCIESFSELIEDDDDEGAKKVAVDNGEVGAAGDANGVDTTTLDETENGKTEENGEEKKEEEKVEEQTEAATAE